MRYLRPSRALILTLTIIVQLSLIVPGLPQNNNIAAEVAEFFDTIPSEFNSCTTDLIRTQSMIDLAVTKKLAGLSAMGEGIVPVLVANITSEKNSDKFKGGNSFASLCALSLLAKEKLNFNRVYEIIDDYFPSKIYAATFSFELNRKIQLEIIDQLGNVECVEQDEKVHCWLK